MNGATRAVTGILFPDSVSTYTHVLINTGKPCTLPRIVQKRCVQYWIARDLSFVATSSVINEHCEPLNS